MTCVPISSKLPEQATIATLRSAGTFIHTLYPEFSLEMWVFRKLTCGPIFSEAFKPGVAICPQHHITEEGRLATVRTAGAFVFTLYLLVAIARD